MLNKTAIRSSMKKKHSRSPLKSKTIRKRKAGIRRGESVSTRDSEKVANSKRKINKKVAKRYRIKSNPLKSKINWKNHQIENIFSIFYFQSNPSFLIPLKKKRSQP